MLAVLLAQVKLCGVEEISDELEFLLESGDNVLASASSNEDITFLTMEQGQRLESFAKNHIFKPVVQHLREHEDEWRTFLESNTPELSVPTPWEASTPAVEALRAMLIIKCLRPDRLLQSTAQFVHNVFIPDVSAPSVYELGAMVSDEVPAATPLAGTFVFRGHGFSRRIFTR
ncbi:hypothetical protein EV359DRAFT_80163 [Lentinula novae-zelandiae]|nr:hypothetical protein EV359DRAFT_80163 [Lentinula novae-zelandiae]